MPKQLKKKKPVTKKKKLKASPKSIKEEIWQLKNGNNTSSAESEAENKVSISDQLARRCTLPSCRKKCSCVLSDCESNSPSGSESSDSGSASASAFDSATEETEPISNQQNGSLPSSVFQEFQRLQLQEQKQQKNSQPLQAKPNSSSAQNAQTHAAFPINYDSELYYDSAAANNNNYSDGSDGTYGYYSESDTSDDLGRGGGGGHSRNCQCQQCNNSGSGELCCYSSCSPALKAVFVVLLLVLTIGCIGLATTPTGPPPTVYYY